MRILYLTYDGLTDPLGQSQIIPYLSGLANNGYKITIISFEKSTQFKKRNNTINLLLNEYGIDWKYISYTKNPPIIGTLWDIYRLTKFAKELYNKQHFNIVHCRSYITSLVGLNLKSKYGIKFLFDMRGFYADERVDGKIWNRSNPIFNYVYRYFKKKEIEFLTKADYTISLTENGKNEIHNWNTIPNQPIPIEVIPCCADLNHFSHKNTNSNKVNQLKKEFGIKQDDFILSYLGSIGTWYMLPEMLHFFKELLKEKPNSKFLFITQESTDFILSSCLEQEIPTNKIIVKKANREDIPNYLMLSQVNLFFILPVFSKKASSPTKMGEVLSMGIPIICNSGVGDVDDILENSNCGLIIKQFNELEYLKIINQIDTLLNIPKEEIILISEKNFSLEKGIEKYKQVYKTLTPDK